MTSRRTQDEEDPTQQGGPQRQPPGHLSTMGSHRCTTCGKVFVSASACVSHSRSTHQEKVKIAVDEETTYEVFRENGVFECVYEGCDYQHQVPKVFASHVRKCTGGVELEEEGSGAMPAGVVAVVPMGTDITGKYQVE